MTLDKRRIQLGAVILWALGAMFLSLRIGVQNISFKLRLNTAKPITDHAVIELFDQCKSQFKLKLPVTLAATHEISSPAIYGLFHPVLLLPKQMISEFTMRELAHIFLHELSHVKRKDMAINWVVTGLKIFHWFNPILWIAFRRISIDRELACDELALSMASQHENRSYGETIIKLLENCTRSSSFSSALGILENKQQVVRRISMIARFEKTSGWPIVAVSLFAALSVVGLTDAEPGKVQQKTEKPQPIHLESQAGEVPSAPRFHGKSCGEWLEQIEFGRGKGIYDKDFVQANDAFREMGQSAIPFLLAKLRAPGNTAQAAETQQKVAWVLKEIESTSETVIPDLIPALVIKQNAVCFYIAMALGEIGPKAKAAIPALLESFRSGNGSAAMALVKIDPDNPMLVSVFTGQLTSSISNALQPVPGQREIYAAQALQRLGPPAKAAIPALRKALLDPNLKIYAAYALRSIAFDQPDIVAEVEAILVKKPTPAPNLGHLIDAAENATGHEAAIALQKVLLAVRQQTALDRNLLHERVLPLTMKLLDSAQPRDFGLISSQLPSLGTDAKSFVPQLMHFLQHDDSGSRANVVGALSQITPGDKQTLALLIKLADDSLQPVRGNACAALARFGPEASEAISVLRTRLKERAAWIRFNASLALWRIAQEIPSVAILQQGLQIEPNGDYHSLATLEMLSEFRPQTEETKSLLRELIQHWSPKVRANAQALLDEKK
jgi:beta-lactamase regulating signal transducer with metallopeptidase domain/HEAT repeat protein